MIDITNATKEAFKTSSTTKTLVITFPELNLSIPMSQIEQESMVLSEKLMDRDVEFVGCYASMFSVSLRDVQPDLKGRRMVVTLQALNTDVIPIFTGIVDSVTMKASKTVKEITAYDELYSKGQIDIASWYNSLTFPITIKNFRDSLFTRIGLTQVVCELPNDDISIIKQYEPKTLQCLPVLKYLCQINGCFGIINRYGLFEYRFIHNAYEPVYPSTTLYPSTDLYPVDPSQAGQGIADDFAYYKSIDYQEFVVNPVERLQIRQNEDDLGITVGNTSGNKYIIQNNMFAYGQPANVLSTMAERIWFKIANISFHPCETQNMGLPYIEVGDVVEYTLPNQNRSRSAGTNNSYQVNKFNVMSRELHGIQALMDSYEAEGEQDQSEFVTDIQAQLDAIKRGGVDMSDYYTKDDIDGILSDNYWTADETAFEVGEITDAAIAQMETPTGFNIVSCYSLPSNPLPNTLYCIQGMTIIL